jgi:hypothetical protein
MGHQQVHQPQPLLASLQHTPHPNKVRHYGYILRRLVPRHHKYHHGLQHLPSICRTTNVKDGHVENEGCSQSPDIFGMTTDGRGTNIVIKMSDVMSLEMDIGKERRYT